MAKCSLSLEYLKVTEAMAKCNLSLNYSQKIFWLDWTNAHSWLIEDIYFCLFLLILPEKRISEDWIDVRNYYISTENLT